MKLTRQQAAVLAAVVQYSQEYRTYWSTKKSIAKAVGTTPTGVDRAAGNLVKKGLLQKAVGGGRWVYRVTAEGLKEFNRRVE